MIRRVRSNIVPSYQGRYARNASESAAPWWWHGLVGAWVPALGPTGAVLRDVSPSGYHAAIEGADPWATGAIGRYLSLNGTNQRASVASVLGMPATGVTLWAQIHLEDTSRRGAAIKIGAIAAGGGDGYALGVGSTQLQLSGNNLIGLYEGVRWIASGISIGTGWHTIAMTILPSNTALLYLDGRLVYSSSGTAPTQPTAGNAHIGGYTGSSGENRWFYGGIAAACSWRRVLTPSEIAQLAADPLIGLRPKRRVIYSIPAGVNYDVALALARTASVTYVGAGAASALLTAARQQGLATTAAAVALDTLGLAAQRAVTAAGQAGASGAVSTGRAHGVDIAGASAVSASVSLPRTDGLDARGGADYPASLTLSVQYGVEASGVAGAAGAVGLTRQQALAAVAGALAAAGVTAAEVRRVTITATAVQVDAYTPSSRIYTVAAQVRTYTVTAQDRTYDVPAQDRTYDVEV